MEFLLIAFVAGLLTILAPCVLPLLPVIIGGSLAQEKTSKFTPLVITGSLAISVLVFTLILRASTVLIDVPVEFWRAVSGGILILFGLLTLFPQIWDNISLKTGFNKSSNKLLGKSVMMKGQGKNVAIGAALGPVFTSCSPTYAVILAVVLPASFAKGFIYLVAYTLGLALVLLLLAYTGQRFASKIAWATNPHGTFKKVLGIIFIVVGLMVLTGFDKTIETYLLEQGVYDGISEFEIRLFGED